MLTRISTQTAAALHAHGAKDFPPILPSMRQHGASEEAAEDLEESTRAQVPVTFTLDMANANVKCLRLCTDTWMPELLNRYVARPAEERGLLGETLEALSRVLGEQTISTYFKTALAQVVDALKALQVSHSFSFIIFILGFVLLFIEAAALHNHLVSAYW
jgi:hypothetical protein